MITRLERETREARINYVLDGLEAKYQQILRKVYSDWAIDYMTSTYVTGKPPKLLMNNRYKYRLAVIISHYFTECHKTGMRQAERDSEELFKQVYVPSFFLVNEYGEINRGLGEAEALVKGSFLNVDHWTNEAMAVMSNPAHWVAVQDVLAKHLDDITEQFPDPKAFARDIADAMMKEGDVKARQFVINNSNKWFARGMIAKYNADPNIVGYTYRTMRDKRVCKVCAPRDGTVFGKQLDGIAFYPPMHPNCRCYLDPIAKADWEGGDLPLPRDVLKPQQGYGYISNIEKEKPVEIIGSMEIAGNPEIPIEAIETDLGYVEQVSKGKDWVAKTLSKALGFARGSGKEFEIRSILGDLVGNIRHSSDRRGWVYLLSDGTFVMVNKALGPFITAAEKHGMGIEAARQAGYETSLNFYLDKRGQWWGVTHSTFSLPPMEEIERIYGKPNTLVWLGLADEVEDDEFASEATVGGKSVKIGRTPPKTQLTPYMKKLLKKAGLL